MEGQHENKSVSIPAEALGGGEVSLSRQVLPWLLESRGLQPGGALLLGLDEAWKLWKNLGKDRVEMIFRQLQDAFPVSGLVLRWGWDEILFLTEETDEERLAAIGEGILKVLFRRVRSGGRFLRLSGTIGIAQGSDADALIEDARTALEEGKIQRRELVIYRPSMKEAQRRKALLARDLEKAIESEELFLQYQPVADLRSGSISQAEALIRWNHGELGVVMPSEFIPLAEESGLIIPITEWVIDTVCRQMAAWQEEGLGEVRVSVNLSWLSFEDSGKELVSVVEGALRDTGLSSSCLKLEISEETLMNEEEEVHEVFALLRSLGVRLALDRFGTGYSSFRYLRDLPLDLVKLDGSLVQDLEKSSRERLIAEALISILHNLGIQVVIEGVETWQQLELLRDLRCDYLQGYFYSHPLGAGDYRAFCLEKGSVLPWGDSLAPAEESLGGTLVWKRSWMSGDAEIDRQHKELLVLGNQVVQASLREGQEELLAKVEALVARTAAHFRHEEDVMASAGYPGLKHHAQEHLRLLYRVEKLQKVYLYGQIKASAFFSFIMDDFILGHMLTEDVKFFPWLKRDEKKNPEQEAPR